MSDTRQKWDDIYIRGEGAPAHPCRVLEENAHLLAKPGKALEIACGLGGNALFLASQGLQVEAWDISPVAVESLDERARQMGLVVETAVRDILQEPPATGSYDVIVVSHFLDRELIPRLIDILRPGGLVFYQTFTQTCVSSAGPSQLKYRLADNELLRLFAGFHLLFYREEGVQGDRTQGFRDLAQIVARKPENGA